MSTETTDNLLLPYILAAQAQKHVTHNEAIRALDALVQLSVLDRDLAAPPGAPVDGARYIVAASPTGAWAGHAGKIAAWQDGAWEIYSPREGWVAWIADEDILVAWSGTAWVTAGGGGGSPVALNPATGGLVGVNATADTTNRLAVKSNAVLLSHDDVSPGTGDMRAVLNKSATARTGSFLFQTGYSGRAEFGLAGDDDFRLKVSANGSAWTDALVAKSSNGQIGIGTSNPVATLTVGDSGSVGAKFSFRGNPSQALGELRTGSNNAFALSIYNDAYSTSQSIFSYFPRSTGTFEQGTDGALDLKFYTSGYLNTRLTIKADGKIGIGTASPSCQLHVAGPIRTASYTVAGQPSASGSGPGAMIYVTNPATGQPRPYWSNGSEWRDAAGALLA